MDRSEQRSQNLRPLYLFGSFHSNEWLVEGKLKIVFIIYIEFGACDDWFNEDS